MTREEQLKRMIFEELVSMMCDTKIFSEASKPVSELKSIVESKDYDKIQKLYEMVTTGE